MNGKSQLSGGDNSPPTYSADCKCHDTLRLLSRASAWPPSPIRLAFVNKQVMHLVAICVIRFVISIYFISTNTNEYGRVKVTQLNSKHS